MTLAKVTVETTIAADRNKVWDYFTEPEHITKWNAASEDWHCPSATNDLRAGGKFSSRMEAKDGSEGFDFEGIYDDVVPLDRISYTMSDGRQATNVFTDLGGSTKVTTIFDPENEFPVEFQQQGWQAILDSFRKYTEAN